MEHSTVAANSIPADYANVKVLYTGLGSYIGRSICRIAFFFVFCQEKIGLIFYLRYIILYNKQEKRKMVSEIEQAFGVSGKVALLTGAAGGIGGGIAAALARARVKLALIDINKKALATAKECLQRLGVEVVALECDITKKPEVISTVNKVVATFGTLDFLINCAGLSYLEPTPDFDEQKWDLVIGVNLKGTFLLCQAAGRVMLEHEFGRIVNFSSVRGLQGRAGDTAYAPSKGAVNQLTRSLAIEWATKGINVNAIAPSFTLTEMNRDQIENEDTYRWIMTRLPKKRLCTVQDLAGPTMFLLSPAAEFITGHILYVDGGWTAA
jgi:NAD(P)-dependent dehydrogenase (short-subunit alcohol dehydrogenase family)